MSYIVGIKADLVSDSVEFELGSIGQTSDGKVYKWVQYDKSLPT